MSTLQADESYVGVEVFQNILSHNTLISVNILSGDEYFDTSSPKSQATFGNTNIETIITQSPIKANLIELIAGFILSSFHHESISKTPHHKIYIIENIQANNTIIDIANKIKSQNSILDVNKVWFDEAKAVSINIKKNN